MLCLFCMLNTSNAPFFPLDTGRGIQLIMECYIHPLSSCTNLLICTRFPLVAHPGCLGKRPNAQACAVQLELQTCIPNSTPVLHKPPACNIGFTLPASCLRSSAVKKEMIKAPDPRHKTRSGNNSSSRTFPKPSINARSVTHPLGTDCTATLHCMVRMQSANQPILQHHVHLTVPHTTQLHIVGVVDISMPYGACLLSTVNKWQCSQSAISKGRNRLA
jgi:hypothetical protein